MNWFKDKTAAEEDLSRVNTEQFDAPRPLLSVTDSFISQAIGVTKASILPSTGHEKNTVQPITDKWLSSPSHFTSFYSV